MAKEKKPGGTNRLIALQGNWPTCELCGLPLWVKPLGPKNPHLVGRCERHTATVHLPSPQADSTAGLVLSEPDSEAK